MNEQDICLGCFRSLAEIVGWADADNPSRQWVLDVAKSRRQAYREQFKTIL